MTQQDWLMWLQLLTGNGGTPVGTNPLDVFAPTLTDKR